jgi:membrane fusion protein, multidrug efflux system
MSGRRGRGLLLWCVIGALLIIGGGFLATQVVRSPAQQAVERAAPAASVITAPVEQRVLAEAIVTRATVQAQGTVNVIPAGGSGGGKSLVSKLPYRAGEKIQIAQTVVEISGRPVIALPGNVPAYRDLAPGSRGPDVEQLQAALQAAEYSIGSDKNGEFGDGTKKAITELYKNRDYDAPVGGGIPMAELVYLKKLPVTVMSVGAKLGSAVDEAKLMVADGPLVAVAPTTTASQSVVRDGMKATVTSEILGKSVDGTVAVTTTLAPDTGGAPADASAQGAGQVPPSDGKGLGGPEGPSLVITPKTALTSNWAGQDVRVEIASAATEKKVLAVPSTAVSMGADGKTTVIVVTGSAGAEKQTRVAVAVGTTAGGFVEVRPTSAELNIGDRVLVGIK